MGPWQPVRAAPCTFKHHTGLKDTFYGNTPGVRPRFGTFEQILMQIFPTRSVDFTGLPSFPLSLTDLFEH